MPLNISCDMNVPQKLHRHKIDSGFMKMIWSMHGGSVCHETRKLANHPRKSRTNVNIRNNLINNSLALINAWRCVAVLCNFALLRNLLWHFRLVHLTSRCFVFLWFACLGVALPYLGLSWGTKPESSGTPTGMVPQ